MASGPIGAAIDTGDGEGLDMLERTEDQVEAVSDQVATFIVDGLQWDGTKDELLGPEPVELPFALDSTDLLELAGYLEDTFAIVIDDDEIVAENFATVRHLARLIVEKQSGVVSA